MAPRHRCHPACHLLRVPASLIQNRVLSIVSEEVHRGATLFPCFYTNPLYVYQAEASPGEEAVLTPKSGERSASGWKSVMFAPLLLSLLMIGLSFSH